jgi:hypothetical protein
MKISFYLAILISVIIVIYGLAFWGFSTDLAIIIELIAAILAFYGYVLLKCCYCCKTTKRKR